MWTKLPPRWLIFENGEEVSFLVVCGNFLATSNEVVVASKE